MKIVKASLYEAIAKGGVGGGGGGGSNNTQHPHTHTHTHTLKEKMLLSKPDLINKQIIIQTLYMTIHGKIFKSTSFIVHICLKNLICENCNGIGVKNIVLQVQFITMVFG